MSEEKKDVVVPAKFEKLVAEIEKMSVLDLSELRLGWSADDGELTAAVIREHLPRARVEPRLERRLLGEPRLRTQQARRQARDDRLDSRRVRIHATDLTAERLAASHKTIAETFPGVVVKNVVNQKTAVFAAAELGQAAGKQKFVEFDAVDVPGTVEVAVVEYF